MLHRTGFSARSACMGCLMGRIWMFLQAHEVEAFSLEVIVFLLEVPAPLQEVAAGLWGHSDFAGNPCAFTVSCCGLARSLRFCWKSLRLHCKLLRARVVAWSPTPWQEVALGSRGRRVSAGSPAPLQEVAAGSRVCRVSAGSPAPWQEVNAGSRGRCVSAGSPCAFTTSCCGLARSLRFRWKSLRLHCKLLLACEVVAIPLEVPVPSRQVAAGSRGCCVSAGSPCALAGSCCRLTSWRWLNACCASLDCAGCQKKLLVSMWCMTWLMIWCKPQKLCRYVVDVSCDTWSDAGFENGYETRFSRVNI